MCLLIYNNYDRSCFKDGRAVSGSLSVALNSTLFIVDNLSTAADGDVSQEHCNTDVGPCKHC